MGRKREEVKAFEIELFGNHAISCEATQTTPIFME